MKLDYANPFRKPDDYTSTSEIIQAGQSIIENCLSNNRYGRIRVGQRGVVSLRIEAPEGLVIHSSLSPNQTSSRNDTALGPEIKSVNGTGEPEVQVE